MKTKLVLNMLFVLLATQSYAQTEDSLKPACGQYELLANAHSMISEVSTSINKLKKNIVIEKYVEALSDLQADHDYPVEDFISDVAEDAEALKSISGETKKIVNLSKSKCIDSETLSALAEVLAQADTTIYKNNLPTFIANNRHLESEVQNSQELYNMLTRAQGDESQTKKILDSSGSTWTLEQHISFAQTLHEEYSSLLKKVNEYRSSRYFEEFTSEYNLLSKNIDRKIKNIQQDLKKASKLDR